MLPIPIDAAAKIAKQYGYDQVIIYGRRVGEAPAPHGEHLTSYGVNREHCAAAKKISEALQRLMQWKVTETA